MTQLTDYTSSDATELAGRVRRREIQPSELVEQAIAAIEAVNPRLNAVIHKMYDSARAAARTVSPDAPFAGVPMVLKDLDGFVAGEPYTASCRALAKFVPDHDAEIVARLRRAGFLFVGKTNTPELGLLAVTEPALHGPTRNPWDPERAPGGSSGGTAAIVAACAVPIGHAADGGGSIRIPASACGLFGLKPSRGRNPMGPDASEGWGGLTQAHVLSRSVRDSAALLDLLGHGELGAPYASPPRPASFLSGLDDAPTQLRIAFSTGSLYGKAIAPEHAEAVRDAARLCESLGHRVEEASPRFDRDTLVRAYFVQVAAGMAASLDEIGVWTGRTVRSSDVEPSTWLMAQIGRGVSAADLQRARDHAQQLGRVLAQFHQHHDLFLCATTAGPPPRIGELAPTRVERMALGLLRAFPAQGLLERVLADLGAKNLERTPNTMMFNQTGQPAMSVPLGVGPTGLPIGVQFVARFAEEDLLLRLARQLERARPWRDRRPQVCA